MKDCLWCQLVRKESPSYMVMDTPRLYAFLDIFPSSPGHSVVILKKHGRTILDYSKEELGELMQGAQVIAQKIHKALAADHITMGINHLEPTGVGHLHLHLIPRYFNDGGGVIQSVTKARSNKPEEKQKLLEISEKLRKA